jgi:hypothetical protein
MRQLQIDGAGNLYVACITHDHLHPMTCPEHEACVIARIGDPCLEGLAMGIP